MGAVIEVGEEFLTKIEQPTGETPQVNNMTMAQPRVSPKKILNCREIYWALFLSISLPSIPMKTMPSRLLFIYVKKLICQNNLTINQPNHDQLLWAIRAGTV